jgi:cellulase (glycosyl hydrolase family 5)/type IX secretion system substrate protein
MRTLIRSAALLLFAAAAFPNNSTNIKFNKWLSPSFFRGYNVLYEAPKTQQDFTDFKNYGGNYFSINTDGFLSEDEPYDTVQSHIAGTDLLVNYCRNSGIYYSIAVRTGPGAYDTYDESEGWTPESRIWFTGSTDEQQKYAEMLQMIVSRYSNDSLFIGITLVVEPRPKVRSIPANQSALYKYFLESVYNIHMDNIYKFWVDKIREIDTGIPVILENFAYSTPELFPPYEINDPYIVYSFHNYQPVQYTRPSAPFSVSYPGVYWNITTLSQVLFDSAFIANTIFGKVREFQASTGKPVLMGEMGMFKPQNGGPDFIKDVAGTSKSLGWHFAIWDWRNGASEQWSFESFTGDNNAHWKAVLKEFHSPPVPGLLSPQNDEILPSFPPVFVWDSLTSFTKYDLEITNKTGFTIAFIEDITNSHYIYSGPHLTEGVPYRWKVRSKNPGGLDENKSKWSAERVFSWSALLGNTNNNNELPREFNLYQNYPNPFNPTTMIKYEMPKNSHVIMRVYDVSGRLINEVVNEYKHAGAYYIEFNASSLSSGVYYYQITSDTFSDTKKMIVIK